MDLLRYATRLVRDLGSGCVAAVLILGLGLSGVGPCLCAAEPARAPDPHACCMHAAGHEAGVPSAGAFVDAAGTPCCTSHTTPVVVARASDRDVLRHALLAAVVTPAVSERLVAPSTLGTPSTASPHFAPPRTTVLRV